MVHAIRIHKPGGPDALVWDEVEVADPGAGQVRLKQTAIGLNYIDVYHRTGLYPLPSYPAVLGMEAAGVVEAVGPGVTDLGVGDRVAYASGPVGAYAQARLMPADRLVKLPPGIDDRQAAAMMLQGMTVEYLLHRTHRTQPGDTLLVHAAAGGVGLILCQWAKSLGARVIGVVRSDAKAGMARAAGATDVIVSEREPIVDRVKALTGGRGVDVVYDSVGKDTFMQSLDCLRPLGLIVSYGQSSGPIPPVDLGILSAKGSLFLTRPTLMTYTAKRDDLVASAAKLVEVVLSGVVKIHVNQTFPLAEAAAAHRAIESRQTTGSTVLLP